MYPDQPDPLHYGTLISWRLGGEDLLDGISIYDGGDFRHSLAYGFSELYEKETERLWVRTYYETQETARRG